MFLRITFSMMLFAVVAAHDDEPVSADYSLFDLIPSSSF
jgi:hypothetical protein